jgi:hypothetical protein
MNIVTADGIISDVDLQIEIPKEKLSLPPLSRNNTLKRRVRNLFKKVATGNEDVVYIRDVITVRDSNGVTYDLDLDLKVELGGGGGGGGDSEPFSRVESRFTDATSEEEAEKQSSPQPEEEEAAKRSSRPRWKKTSALKNRLSRSKSSILRRSQLLVKPLSDGWRRAWKNSQDIEDGDHSSDQDVSLAPMAGVLPASADLSTARSCMDLQSASKENNSGQLSLMGVAGGGGSVGDSTSTLGRPHMRSTADLFRFTTV